MTRRQIQNLGWSRCIIRHVSIAYGRHCHDRPPKRIGYGFEEAVLTSGFSEVHRRWKQHHTFKNKHTPTENRVRHTVRGGCERAPAATRVTSCHRNRRWSSLWRPTKRRQVWKKNLNQANLYRHSKRRWRTRSPLRTQSILCTQAKCLCSPRHWLFTKRCLLIFRLN